MNVIMVMFDSLNRRFLEPYGCTETVTPNFTRLAKHTVQFNNSYAASLPCIPARRELHTGRYNFLHRSWGPIEPFDDSMPCMLKEHGIHSHLISDHGHYWECGGATYHTQFSTWEQIRGQEGDAWKAAVGGTEDTDPNFVPFTEGLRGELYRQNLANRMAVRRTEDFPLVKTFDAGLEFIKQNGDKKEWFLQIESFAPHEPFMAADEFKRLYPCDPACGKRYEWPDYAKVQQLPEEVDQVRYAYFASLSMCDAQLGRILDQMDEQQLWDNTMLIVNTDHGFMLGEHGYWAKNYMPCYNEVVHTPLFIWDPRVKRQNESRESLVQTIDLPVTILDFFGIQPGKDMQGKSLLPVLERDVPVRTAGLYGMFGGHICCTDGRYVYMRTPRDTSVPLYEYTLMPTHMMHFFSMDELATMEKSKGFSFTKGLSLMRIQTDGNSRCVCPQDFLFDLQSDPGQQTALESAEITARMEQLMDTLLKENDAPPELYRRFGF